MRVAVVDLLLELLEAGRDIHVLTADLGYGLLDPIQVRFPGRFTNVGVAEANMIGLAAGLAMGGSRVFCYSIAPFALFRCLDQIRCDLCAPRLPVTILAAGGGVAYGLEGMTHYAIEDLAVVRALPNLNVFVPADPVEARLHAGLAATVQGPSYLRLGAKNEPIVYPEGTLPEPWQIHRLRQGTDVALLACGTMVRRALRAADLLAAQGVDATVVSVHTLKPLNTVGILALARTHAGLVTLEEHSRIGGLGSAVAEVLVDEGCSIPLARMGLPDHYPDRFGNPEWMRDQAELRPEDITARATALLARACATSGHWPGPLVLETP